MATCKDCVHYKACTSMLEALGYTVDGDGIDADKRCKEFEKERHGRWVKDGNFLICLNCESEIDIKNSLGVENRKNFCPNCGAKMNLKEV